MQWRRQRCNILFLYYIHIFLKFDVLVVHEEHKTWMQQPKPLITACNFTHSDCHLHYRAGPGIADQEWTIICSSNVWTAVCIFIKFFHLHSFTCLSREEISMKPTECKIIVLSYSARLLQFYGSENDPKVHARNYFPVDWTIKIWNLFNYSQNIKEIKEWLSK